MKKTVILIFWLFTFCSAAEVPIEQMIGQMIAVGFDGNKTNQEWPKLLKSQIGKGEVGAIVIYGRNIQSPMQLERLISHFHYAIAPSAPPLWVMVDQEGGRVARLNAAKGFSNYPSAKALARGNTQNAAKEYRALACELRGYAINFNLAPVVDLDIDGGLIGGEERSFSDDPEIIAKYAQTLIKAHNSCNVLTALKHFPGHSGVRGDPHIDTADRSAQYDETELIAFRQIIEANLAHAVMIAHIIDTNVDRLPATLSKKHIDRLRGMKFNGVAITDDLQMGAIAKHYDLNQTVILAINAGNDILLFSNVFDPDPALPVKVKEIVLEAIKAGIIPIGRIKEAYNRIIALKKKRLM
ncbi:MAG: hypothetical protein LBN32_00120 [Helicobacteraceae bacterium]|nr:hypothetical protein [Helicobacteraceae bacterium]